MFLFCTRNGVLYDQDGAEIATGYSGHEQGRNEPIMECHARLGPIPRGNWLIAGPPEDTEMHGPYVLRLVPKATTNTFGRGGFLMHGDSRLHPGTASLGCVILPLHIRKQVWESGDRDLLVIGSPPVPLNQA